MATRSMSNKNDRHRGETRRRRPEIRPDHELEDQRTYLERGNEQVREMLADREGQAVLVALAFGFGVGLVIGYNLGGTHHGDRWADRIAAEGLGRRLFERFESYLPDSISSKMCK